MAMGYDGSIRIDSRVDTKGFNSGVKSMGNALKPLLTMLGVAFSGVAIVNFAKSSVQAASQLSSALIGLESIMDGMGMSFSKAKDFIAEYTKDGLIPATNAITAYKNLALRGYSTEQIDRVMTALKDSAAFGRQSSYTMGEAVQWATEGLKNENSILVDNAGVTKNVSMMWQDWAKAHNTTVAAMTKEEKIMAEVAGIMEETRFQTGDAAKATMTFAGQTSALSVSFLALKVAIGNAIIPVLTAIIPYVRAVIDWLTALFTTFAQFISILFGVQIAAQGAGDGVGDMGQEAGQAGQKVGGAGKAAKGALAAFDELNVLAQDTGGDGGTPPGGIPGGGIPGIGDPEEEGGALDAMAEKVAAFKERMLTLLGPLIEAFGRLKEALTPLGETIWRGLKWAWDNILVPLGEWVITDLLPTFLGLLAGAATLLNGVLIALEPLWTWFWDNVLEPIAEWTAGAIIDILEWLTEALYKISDWIANNQVLFRAFVIFLGTIVVLFAAVYIGIQIYVGVMWLATAATTAFTAILAILTSPITLVILAIAALVAIIYVLISYWPQISEAAQAAWDWIVGIWEVVAQWFDENVIQPVVVFFTTLWDQIELAAQAAWTWISGVWEVVAAWFDTNVITPLRNFFQGFIDWWGIVFYDVWIVISGIWAIVAQWFQDNVITPLQNFFSAAWEAIKGFFSSAWTTISEVWQTVSTWFQDNVITPMQTAFDTAWKAISGFFSDTWEDIKKVWEVVSTWFTENVVDPIKSAFDTMLYGEDGKGGLVGAFTTAWESIKSFLKGILNGIIGLINGVLGGVFGGVNGLIDSINAAGEVFPGFVPIPHITAPQIPALATGAVIPPNAQFLAMLGDQRSGRNLEAPEALIRQIVREESGGTGGDIRIGFDGDLSELIRILNPVINRENTRIGKSMVSLV